MIKNIAFIFLISYFAITPLFGKNGEMQLFNFSGKSKNNERTSTEITSNELKILTNENKIVFIKNVIVDDQSMIIHCDKMIVYLAKKNSDKGDKKKSSPISSIAGGSGSGKKLEKIECIGNVTIIRKLYDKKELEVGEQKGCANHVTYFPDNGKIVMKGKPILFRGTDSLKAKKTIIIYKNEGAITTEGRVKIITYPKNKN